MPLESTTVGIRAPAVATRPAPAKPRTRGVRHPGLDGVRGIAVLAVFLFHTDVDWMQGGYLGVDVFFVLSGFLITSLLLGELDRTARIDLRRFWARRSSRILPTLLALVAIGVVFGSFVAPFESARGLREDAIATVGQVVNWRFVDTIGHSLVGAVRSPFQHCWSLAIEMQFYLLWPPLVMLVAYGRAKGQRRRNVGLLAGALALASAVAMLALVGPGWHTQRAYYGTDTRAQALLVGAVLAAIIGHRLHGDHEPPSPLTRVAVSALGTAAAVCVLFAFVAAPTSGHTMYEGWYLALAIAVAVVLAQLVIAPASLIPALLSSPPIVALGRISYSLYLWHWPLLLILTEERTGLSGVSLFTARATASLAAAWVSYVLIERRFATR